MRILWHSNAPWCNSGYGMQTRIWVPRLASLGHEVAISAFHGLQSGMTQWEGHTVYPNGQHPYGGDVIGMHARHFRADWIITLMDQWAFPAQTLAGLNVACWMPVDCEPLGQFDVTGLEDKRALARRMVPIAFSRFGERVLRDAGFSPMYVPHGIETGVYTPPENRKALRESMGIDGNFVIVMNAANLDKQRKGYPEQFAAFGRLVKAHPEALLLVHAVENTPTGLNLRQTAERMDIMEQVKFSAQYFLATGLIEPDKLRGTYGAADLFSNCSLAEGFGLTALESLSCGVPVVTTDCSASTEVAGPGAFLVKGEPCWAAGHDSWWRRPYIDGIYRAYEKGYAKGPAYAERKKRARPHALSYDADRVLTEHWKPALERLEGML